MQHPLLYLIAYLFFAIVCYSLDRRFGVAIYRWWYNFSHKEPLPAETIRGFIYNRPAKNRATMATIVSLLESLVVVYFLHINPLVGLIVWLVGIPLTLIGFLIGPFSYRLWQKREVLFQTVDKVEAGQIDVTKEMGELAETEAGKFKRALQVIRKKLQARLGQFQTKSPEKSAVKTQSVVAAKPTLPLKESPEEKLAQDPQALIDKFLRKKR